MHSCATRPVPAADEPGVNVVRADGASPDRKQLNMCPGVGGGEWGDIDRVSDGLVTGRVNHVPQGLFGILDAAAFRVSVPQEDQLLLLSGPQPAHTLSVHLKEATERLFMAIPR